MSIIREAMQRARDEDRPHDIPSFDSAHFVPTPANRALPVWVLVGGASALAVIGVLLFLLLRGPSEAGPVQPASINETVEGTAEKRTPPEALTNQTVNQVQTGGKSDPPPVAATGRQALSGALSEEVETPSAALVDISPDAVSAFSDSQGSDGGAMSLQRLAAEVVGENSIAQPDPRVAELYAQSSDSDEASSAAEAPSLVDNRQGATEHARGIGSQKNLPSTTPPLVEGSAIELGAGDRRDRAATATNDNAGANRAESGESAIDIAEVLERAKAELNQGLLVESSVPVLGSLSQQTKDAIPTILYSEHDWNPSGQSAVVLNGQRLIAGQRNGGVLVKDVLVDSVILEVDGQTFRLAALNSWVNL